MSGPRNKCTPLIGAVERFQPKMIEILLEAGADIHKKDDEGCEPIVRMIEFRHNHPSNGRKVLAKRATEALKIVLQHGASPDEALLHSIVHDHADMTKVLLLAANLNPQYVGRNRATHGGRLAQVGTDCTGMCYIGVAAFRCNLPLIKQLVSMGADLHYVQVDGVDKGCNALLLALQSYEGWADKEKDETKVLKVVRYLLSNGMNPNQQAGPQKSAVSALHLAVRAGFFKVTKLLLESGADPNVSEFGSPKGSGPANGDFGTPIPRENDGATPLSTALTCNTIAASGNRAKYVQLLVKHGVDVNQVCYMHQRTPWGMMVSPEFQVPLKTALLRDVSSNVIETMLEAGAVVTHGTHDQRLTELIARLNPAMASTIATKGNASILGGGLLGKRLWLTCMLKGVVAANMISSKLELKVQRENIVGGGIWQQLGIDAKTGELDAAISHATPLMVRFEGEDSEGDGLRREWLQNATAELCDLQRGLFISSDGGRTLQPNPESGVAAGDDHLSYFALLARIVGFAIFHGETIPVRSSVFENK